MEPQLRFKKNGSGLSPLLRKVVFFKMADFDNFFFSFGPTSKRLSVSERSRRYEFNALLESDLAPSVNVSEHETRFDKF